MVTSVNSPIFACSTFTLIASSVGLVGSLGLSDPPAAPSSNRPPDVVIQFG